MYGNRALSAQGRPATAGSNDLTVNKVKRYSKLLDITRNRIGLLSFIMFCKEEGVEKGMAMWLDAKCCADYILRSKHGLRSGVCAEYVKMLYLSADSPLSISMSPVSEACRNISFREASRQNPVEFSNRLLLISDLVLISLENEVFGKYIRSTYYGDLVKCVCTCPIMFRSFDITGPFSLEFPTAVNVMEQTYYFYLSRKGSLIQDDKIELYRRIFSPYLDDVVSRNVISFSTSVPLKVNTERRTAAAGGLRTPEEPSEETTLYLYADRHHEGLHNSGRRSELLHKSSTDSEGSGSSALRKFFDGIGGTFRAPHTKKFSVFE